MTNLEKLLSYIPDIYKKNNNLIILEAVASCFDNIDKLIEDFKGTWIVDAAKGKELDVIGGNIQIFRAFQQSDDIYRRRIKVALYNLYFVPILNNYIDLIENIIGYQAENIIEGWRFTQDPESAVLGIDIVVPAGETQALLDDMEKIYSAGVRVEFNKKQEAYAVYEMFGDINNTGLVDINKEKERVVIPIQPTLFATFEEIGEQNNTGTTEIYTANEPIL